MEMIIIISLLIILLAIWVLSTRKKIMILEENVKHSMSQIGVQIDSQYDVLESLLNLARSCSIQETMQLKEKIKTHRYAINAESGSKDVLMQESIISEALDCVILLARQYPELSEHESYKRRISAVESYGTMVRTSSLIYNDAVTKFNRTIRTVPTNLIAGLLGFVQYTYIELAECKNDFRV